jgi:CRP-like cAMP-binding protein
MLNAQVRPGGRYPAGPSRANNLLTRSRPAIREAKAKPPASTIKQPRLNRLLATLSEDEGRRWTPQLESVEMAFGKVLVEPGTVPGFVYFPTTAIVSLQYILADGANTEIAVVGHDGFVGVSMLMGGGSALSRAVVRSAGQSYRLRASAMVAEFGRDAATRLPFLRYTQALITQMAQTAVCNRHHSIPQQLCRWLLLGLDRSQGDELMVTQELIAQMLGVRRGGITEAARQLQNDGLIRYARGRIRVLDRAGLEHEACECYSIVEKEYLRLMPDPRAT